jgi:hypothetical protein
LGELVAAWIARQLGWIVAAEVSFAIYRERGIIDRLACTNGRAHLWWSSSRPPSLTWTSSSGHSTGSDDWRLESPWPEAGPPDP